MQKTGNKQINSPEEWDTIYYVEKMHQNKRIINERLRWVEEMVRGFYGKVLDVGCGWGELFSILHSCGCTYDGYGVDICPNTLDNPIVNFKSYLASAESLPFGDATFDLVFCGETLEHLDNPKKAIQEIVRVCKPKGMILLTTPLGKTNKSWHHTHYFFLRDFDFKGLEIIDIKITNEKQICIKYRKI